MSRSSLLMSLAIIAVRAGQSFAQSAPQPTQLGLEGYCPVCITMAKKWVKGSPEHQVAYDGKTYRFPDAKTAATFKASPAKFVPALNGDCTVCLAKMNKRMPGSVHHSATYRGRLFLFPGEKQKKMFLADPKSFAQVDLAYDGNCSVCLAEMKKQVPGKPEFTVVRKGLRYLFPGEKQRKMFEANPEKYEVRAPAAPARTSATQAEAAKMVVFQGKSGCAACDHSVHPLRDANQLGLALTASDGNVYILEDGHTRFPKIYAKRFDSLDLRVVGKVLKTSGRFRWVETDSVTQL